MRSILFASILFAISCSIAAADTKRPNILWLVADDHAAYVTGCYGNPLVHTPNIDRLASTGCRFDRAYCNSPICTASRQSFITGQYPRTVGVTLLNTPLPENQVTLAHTLRDAGYESASYGKMHFNSNLKHGFDQRLDLPDWVRTLQSRGRAETPDGVEVFPVWKPFKDPARVWLNSMTLPQMMAADTAETFFADAAEKFLTTTHDKPFFLMVSFYTPHSPFHFPVEYRGRYDPAKMPVGRKGPGDGDQVPEVFRELTDREKQGIVASCYTSTDWTDHNVGRVLDALEKSGHADDTIVVYLGDHGYMLGQHGRFEKHCSYEPAVRAPLIMRYPSTIKPGSSTSALVEFIDIVPTLLDFCGVSIPPAVQGRSLAPLLTGKADTHRDHVFITYGHNDEAMVSDGRWKLIYQRGKRTRDDGYDPNRPLPGPTLRLFDLQSDPDEFANLAATPEQAARVKTMVALLAADLKRTSRHPDTIPRTTDPMVILDFCVQADEAQPSPHNPRKAVD